jgi:hypothetical protein
MSTEEIFGLGWPNADPQIAAKATAIKPVKYLRCFILHLLSLVKRFDECYAAKAPHE